jgi:hypothetical protein
MTDLPPNYDMDRCPLGTYRWRFTVGGVAPLGQKPGATHGECRQAAWDHWVKTNNAKSLPLPIGIEDWA